MTPTEKDALNREFHELVGKHLHEWTNKDDPKHPDRICTRCGVKITERNYADDVLDYVADPRLVLREMDRLKKRESFINYLLRTENTWSILDMAFDFMIDTTGRLRDKAIEFMKEARL